MTGNVNVKIHFWSSLQRSKYEKEEEQEEQEGQEQEQEEEEEGGGCLPRASSVTSLVKTLTKV